MKTRRKHAWTTAVLLLLAALALGGASCPGREGRVVSVSASTPNVADGRDESEVTVSVRDGRGRPVEDADVLVTLYVGEDVAQGVVAESAGDGVYRASVASATAGMGTIQAMETGSGARAETEVLFRAGPATEVLLRLGEPVVTPAARGVVVEALVEDANLNEVLPPAADVELRTSAGRLGEVSVNETGLFRATLTWDGFGTAIVTATDRTSGLTSTIEVEFPALELTCPNLAVQRTGEPDEETAFDLPLTAFIPPGERLDRYTIELTLNELTSFTGAADGDPDDALGAPEVERVGPRTVRLFGASAGSGPAAGLLHLADLTFNCLGEGFSTVEITGAELVGAPGAILPASLRQDGRRLPDQPRRGAECPNKLVRRKLCVNPILVKGFNLADDRGADVTKSTVILQIQKIQENFDRACCKISLRVGDRKAADLTDADLKEIDDPDFRNGLSDEFSQTGTTALLADDEIKLIRRHADKRLADCINLYFVDKLPHSKGEAIRPGTVDPSGTGRVARVLRRKTPRNAEVKVDGNGNPDAGGTPVADEDLRAVIVGENGMKERSLKHEVGHFLGLLHPNDYTGAGLKDATKGSVMEQCTHKGESFRPKECELIEQDVNGLLKPIR